MKVVLTRVDSRLVHGQVVEDWVPATGADLLVVANDEAAGDPMQSLILESCTFCGDALVKVVPVSEVSALLSAPPPGRRAAIVLVRDVADAVRLRSQGVAFDALNLGNIHAHPGARSVSPSVSLDDTDVRSLEGLVSEGVDVRLRAVSRERAVSLAEALGGAGV